MNKLLWALLLFLMGFKGLQSSHALNCPHYKISGDFVAFSEGEKVLLCGDENFVEWNKIPQKQVRAQLENILYNRGYPHPEVAWTSTDLLSFKAGKRATLDSLDFSGFPENLQEAVLAHVALNGALDQQRVSSIEKGVKGLLTQHGYPCAQVTIRADLEGNKIFLKAGPFFESTFPKVTSDLSDSSQLLERFEAFEEGWEFDQKKVDISERRIRASNYVNNAFYYTSCSPDQKLSSLKRVVFPGPSKFISFGVGFDTEEYFLLKGKYEKVWLSDGGSKVNTTAGASLSLQELKVGVEDHFLKPSDRLKFLYELSLSREYEKSYELVASHFSPKLNKFIQFRPISLSVNLGSYIERQWLLQGAGRKVSKIIGFESDITIESTLHEYYAQQPRTGFLLSSALKTSHKNLYSDFDAQSLNNNFEVLFLLSESPKVDYVLGARAKWNFLLQTESPENRRDLSPSLFNYLGGSSDIRGFGRKDLGSPNGRISALYLGLELRAAGYDSLQPFIFYDYGGLGDGPFDFDSDFYVSPGFGLRWGTSFGTFRTTAGLGYKNTWIATKDISTHMQFFLSFGEEF